MAVESKKAVTRTKASIRPIDGSDLFIFNPPCLFVTPVITRASMRFPAGAAITIFKDVTIFAGKSRLVKWDLWDI
jgi:hypothetical protein